MNFPERDWKSLRALHPVALDRLCGRILGECREILDDSTMSTHERFLRLYELMQARNSDIAVGFDDLRRSTALQRLRAMRELDVVTGEDLMAFSPETRNAL